MAPAGNKGKRKQKPNRKGSNIGDSNTTNDQSGPHASRTGLDLGVPQELQQRLLNVFQTTFLDQFNNSLSQVVQEVKQHLFNRDFTHAFGNQAFLDAYAMRWSPSRALAYLDIFNNLLETHMHLQTYSCRCHRDFSDKAEHEDTSVTGIIPSPQASPSLFQQEGNTTQVKVLSLGGGAGAEVVALAGLLCDIGRSTRSIDSTSGDLRQPKMIVEVTAIDVADWSSVIARLNASLTTVLAMPRYALGGVANSIASNFDHGSFRVTFGQHDLLKMEVSQMKPLLRNCTLVTFMFTLNELYSTSLSETTKCLLSITDLVQQGSLLLIVDSPGSYSTVHIGRDAKSQDSQKQKEPSAQREYPMLWLLEHTLLSTAIDGTGKLSNQEKQWEKLQGNDSKWFRLPPGLEYPIEIENMRYQLHLYRRL